MRFNHDKENEIHCDPVFDVGSLSHISLIFRDPENPLKGRKLSVEEWESIEPYIALALIKWSSDIKRSK